MVISSAGLTTLDAPLLPNQIATTRVSAQASFEFESAERTRATRAEKRAEQDQRRAARAATRAEMEAERRSGLWTETYDRED